MRKAFTMVELVLVIVVIGILSAIAIPRLSVTRDDAKITNTKSVVANVRTALSSEIQKKILKGDFTPITNVGGETNEYNKPIFNYFDNNTSLSRVLEYPIRSCKDENAKGCWMKTGEKEYTYYFPAAVAAQVGTDSVKFTVNNGRFECDSNAPIKACMALER